MKQSVRTAAANGMSPKWGRQGADFLACEQALRWRMEVKESGKRKEGEEMKIRLRSPISFRPAHLGVCSHATDF